MRTQPLTPEQTNWLRVNAFLPTIILGVFLAVIGTIFACLFTGTNGHPFFIVFFGIAGILLFGILVAVGIHIYNNLMDLREGVAYLHEGVLNRKWHTHRSPKTFYAEFEGAGTVIVMGDIYEKIEEGKMYKVLFSRRTRRGWDVNLWS